MNGNLLLGVAFLALAPLATAGPRGTVPKTSADRYPAHADHDGTKIGAALISPEEARKVFGFDVDRSCLIVEVALYPPNDKERNVSPGEFSLRVTGANAAVKPSAATAVAANWQQLFRVQRDTYDATSAEVAIGPHYGHIEVQVGVETDYGPPQSASEKDRATVEAELTDKGLPEGKASSPVAGYLYFPMLSRKKNTALRLDYETNGGTVIQQLSQNQLRIGKH